MINVISQSLMLDLVNIYVYAKVYQNIPNGLRVIDIFRKLTVDKIFTNSPAGDEIFTSGDKIKCLIIGHTLSFGWLSKGRAI